MKPATARWVKKAESHLGGARSLLNAGFHDQSVFWSQQALEVILKALLIERSPRGIARRTHDLPSLAEELALDLTLAQFDFLRDLSEQYAPTRYADEFVEYSQDSAEYFFRRAPELFEWLRLQLI